MGKKGLIWPTVAEELQASAERRRLQRDREKRARLRTAVSNRTNSPNENSQPLSMNNKCQTPKLKQQTLNKFFGLMVNNNSAPTPIPPTEKRQHNKRPKSNSEQQLNSSSSSSNSVSIIELSSISAGADVSAMPVHRLLSPNQKKMDVAHLNKAIKPTSVLLKHREHPKCWQQQLPSVETRAENERRRVQRLVNRLKKSLNELDRETFAKDLAFTTVRLDNAGVEKIQNKFLRYLVQRELAKKDRDHKIRGIPAAERQQFRRNFDQTKMPNANPHFDHLLAAFKFGKYEDMEVLEPEHRTKFVQLIPVLSDRPQLAQYFGRALALTQFMHAHGHFLRTNTRPKGPSGVPSAEKFLTSLAGDFVGHSANVQPMLSLLANFLSDTSSSPEIAESSRETVVSVRSLRSRAIKQTISLVSQPENLMDVVKALLAAENNMERKSDGGEEECGDKKTTVGLKKEEELGKLFDVCKQLENTSSLSDMNVDVQLTIFEHFVQRVQSTDAFNTYMKDQCIHEQIELHHKKESIQKSLSEHCEKRILLEKDITTFNENVDNLTMFTRKQSGEYSSKLKQLHTLQLYISEIEHQLNSMIKQCRILKINNKCRIVPLGQDRFHRLYWFFADSSDGYALFVQQQQRCCLSDAPINNDDETPAAQNGQKKMGKYPLNDGKENENDDDKQFMQRLTDNVEGRSICNCADGRHCSTADCWWYIQCSNELNSLIGTLTARGLREHQLKLQLNAYRDLIEAGMAKAVARDGSSNNQNDDQNSSSSRDVDGDDVGAESNNSNMD